MKALDRVPWRTMLDLGSGTGAYSFYFSRSPRVHVWGMDIDTSRISECIALNQKLKRKSVDFVCCSRIFETGRVQPNSMDVVLAVEVLHDLPDFQEGLRQIEHVLKPGGYLITHVPLRGYRHRDESILFDAEDLVAFLKQAGLEPVSITRTFGTSATFLARFFSHYAHSRFLTAILFPILLLVSLPFGGANSDGTCCLAAARKTWARQ
jgi:SAM-dependent methyltransferase